MGRPPKGTSRRPLTFRQEKEHFGPKPTVLQNGDINRLLSIYSPVALPTDTYRL